jgi:hypothetical protein
VEDLQFSFTPLRKSIKEIVCYTTIMVVYNSIEHVIFFDLFYFSMLYQEINNTIIIKYLYLIFHNNINFDNTVVLLN